MPSCRLILIFCILFSRSPYFFSRIFLLILFHLLRNCGRNIDTAQVCQANQVNHHVSKLVFQVLSFRFCPGWKKENSWSLFSFVFYSCWACKTRMMQNQVEIFWENDLNFDLFGGPKLPQNRASDAEIQHISKSSSNWHVNGDWCAEVNFWENDWRLEFWPIWDPKMTYEAYIHHTSKSSSND